MQIHSRRKEAASLRSVEVLWVRGEDINFRELGFPQTFQT